MEKDKKSRENIDNIKEQNIMSSDPLFNEIQEILMDQEMIQKKLIENNKESYKLELIFPSELILKKFNVKFLLIIPKKYPKQEPELYCITIFSHPHICDGRNLITGIINKEWTYENIPLDFIINKIPKFIIKYSDYTDKSLIVGKYMFDNLYSVNFLQNLPIFFHRIPETNKIITIGDISLCFYELFNDKEFKYCQLTFFVNIKEIIEIQTKQKNNLIVIKYKSEKTTKKISINSQNYKTINDILTEKMKVYKKKQGHLPDIDIKYLENEIEEKEKELFNKDNKNIIMYKEKCLRLMDIYQQAIEYYSAVNNPKFVDVNNKIHKLMENPILTSNSEIEEKKDVDKKKDIIDKNEIKNKNENDINKVKDKNNNINIEIKKNEKDNKLENTKEEKYENKNQKENEEKKEIKRKGNEVKENTNPQKNEKDDNTPLRLKIDEGELNTLDVGEDEEEEDEENK